MNLCLDIGNTQLKLGYYKEEGALQELVIVPTWQAANLERRLTDWNIKRAIISSVQAEDEELLAYLKARLEEVYILSTTLPLPIVIDYATPRTLGNDRLAVAVAAAALYPQQAALIVDAGTCITYDFVTAEGRYLGGSILPGVAMRFQAMHEFTAKLPLVERANLTTFIGDSTKTSLQTGVLYGVLHELEGFAAQYRQQFGSIIVLVTGGSLPHFESQLKSKIFAAPNLVLDGLNAILRYQHHK
ncbi:MAG: type III pantothenate kinase [Aureispira sp.]